MSAARDLPTQNSSITAIVSPRELETTKYVEEQNRIMDQAHTLAHLKVHHVFPAGVSSLTPVVVTADFSPTYQEASDATRLSVATRATQINASVATTQLTGRIQGSLQKNLTQADSSFLLQWQARKRRSCFYSFAFGAGTLGLFLTAIIVGGPAGFGGACVAYAAVSFALAYRHKVPADRLDSIYASLSRLEINLQKNPENGEINEASRTSAEFICKLKKFVAALDKIDYARTFGWRCSSLLNEIELALNANTSSMDDLMRLVSSKITNACNTPSNRVQKFFSRGEELAFQKCCLNSGLMMSVEALDKRPSRQV